jgi:hypothetical protein
MMKLFFYFSKPFRSNHFVKVYPESIEQIEPLVILHINILESKENKECK